MPQREVIAQLDGRPDTARAVPTESCPACEYVHRYGDGPGVYMVRVGDALYRTEQLDEAGQLMLCVATEQLPEILR